MKSKLLIAITALALINQARSEDEAGFVSLAHSNDVIDNTITAARRAFAAAAA